MSSARPRAGWYIHRPTPSMTQLRELADQVRQRLDYPSFFAEYLPGMRRVGQANQFEARCPFHDGDAPFGVNVTTGAWMCRNPDCSGHAGGDVFDFYIKMRSCTFPEAVRALAGRCGMIVAPPSTGDNTVEPIPENTVQTYVIQLHARPDAIEALKAKCGWDDDTIRRFKIGYHRGRFTIPIYDETGRVMNVRMYDPNAARSEDKMISWRAGYGTARLYPIANLLDSDPSIPVFIFEGEKDTILANQHGLLAVTTTGGAGTWRNGWSVMFSGRDVCVCYDNDDAGRAGARKVATEVAPYAARVRILKIPLLEPAGADFSDFIVKANHSIEDFHQRVVALAEEYRPAAADEEAGTGAAVYTPPADGVAFNFGGPGDAPAPLPGAESSVPLVPLSEAGAAEYNDKPVQMLVLIGGRGREFMVPDSVRVRCTPMDAEMCSNCPNSECDTPGNRLYPIRYRGAELLEYINTDSDRVHGRLKGKLGIPSKCSAHRMIHESKRDVVQMFLNPAIDAMGPDDDEKYVYREAYFDGVRDIEPTQTYRVAGTTVAHPKTQQVTHILSGAEPARTSIEAFEMTPAVRERMTVFRPTEPGVEGLWRHLDRMYDDLEKVTRIVQRRDLMLAVDLTYHSALSFIFQGQRIVRGWVEALFAGDTRTGKSAVAENMLRHYRAGEFTNGENTTRAGLVAAVKQIGTGWTLQWGVLPLNDKRLVIIDEAGNLTVEDIGSMSSLRSSGVAEVVKVERSVARCRVRQIWIANPRPYGPERSTAMSAYPSGVHVVKELIGAAEDIARFDIVVTASQDDVALHKVNEQRSEGEPTIYTPAVCHDRVMWAWSRTHEQVLWAEGSQDQLLRYAMQQGKDYQYAGAVPIVQPNEQRIKLARLAVSAAAMFFSTDASGETIVVRPEHVDFAYQYLERLYNKPSLAYKHYAEACRRNNTLTNPAKVAEIVGRVESAAQHLLDNETFTQGDLEMFLGCTDRDQAKTDTRTLMECRFFVKRGSILKKTPAAKLWLERQVYGAGAAGAEPYTFNADTPEGEMPEAPPF